MYDNEKNGMLESLKKQLNIIEGKNFGNSASLIMQKSTTICTIVNAIILLDSIETNGNPIEDTSKEPEKVKQKKTEKETYDSMPGSFILADFNQGMLDNGIPRYRHQNFLKKLISSGDLMKVRRGVYKKVLEKDEIKHDVRHTKTFSGYKLKQKVEHVNLLGDMSISRIEEFNEESREVTLRNIVTDVIITISIDSIAPML